MIKKLKLILFIVFFVYQTFAHSKTVDNNDFNPKYLSGYLSAIISQNNLNSNAAVKYLNSSKNLMNKHQEFLKKYAITLTIDGRVKKSINIIKSYNKKAGVSLNPETSVEKVLPVLNIIDLVLIMSVNPGFGGQKFMEKTLEKVKILRKKIDSLKLKTQIEIDGGINFENAKKAKEAGVDILVSGTTIFKENEGNLKKNIQLLKTG